MTENPTGENFDAPDQSAGDAEETTFEVPDDLSSLTEEGAPVEPAAGQAAPPASADGDLRAQLDERTADLQRLHAEYVNYKRRVDRDRDVARQRGVEQVVNDLLPVLDAIEMAKQHEGLDGGFKLVVDALEKVTGKYGLVAYGEVGEVFDPTVHEALMAMPMEGDHTEQVVAAVMQKGIKLGERIVRPARVGVADPN
ncbi:nucleotide exchange factor GrpE [Propioniciclava sp.]|uniref:nucleotide exchange factor GrpE n=1 Tax=Propioniciclava sp. TaxID=2038686 RepID=UPI0039E62389